MGFVGNYALCGLSPQTDGMPVIHKTKSTLLHVGFVYSLKGRPFQSSFLADPKKDMRASMLSAWDISGKGFPAEAGAGC